jgi:hypothetical protein
MSLPDFSTQGELFSTAGLAGSLFAETDRYRLFAKLVYPHLVRARAKLEKCYCADNGRVALEPVLLLGVRSRRPDGVPDRRAVELLLPTRLELRLEPRWETRCFMRPAWSTFASSCWSTASALSFPAILTRW